MMKIYLIERPRSSCYCDENTGHVVIAHNVHEVMELAKGARQAETTLVWGTARITKQGEYTGERTEPFILLTNDKSG